MTVRQRPLYALALRLAAAAVLATLLMLVKLTQKKGVSLPEIMFWRQAVPSALLFGYLASRRELHRLRTRRLGSHGRRALIGMTGMVFNFGAVILLPLAIATIFGFTTPLFAVALGALILREQVGPWRWLAVALGFAGVLVIVRPGAMTIPPLGALVGLGSGFMVALVSIQIRDLGRTEEPISTVFYFSLLGAMMMLPVLPFFAKAHSPAAWLTVIAVGLCGAVFQLLLTASLRYGSVTSVVVMDYSSLIWSTLYGWAVFAQLPPATTWLGAPLIIAAGLVITWREHRLAKAPSPLAATALE
ncbi:MAG: DMT family transporter [Novosphingobium sp.]|nr:DMT family transporter [Novosphingobium sp.]